MGWFVLTVNGACGIDAAVRMDVRESWLTIGGISDGIQPVFYERQKILQVGQDRRFGIILICNVDMMGGSWNFWPMRCIVPSSTQFTFGLHPLIRVLARSICEQVVANLQSTVISQDSRQLEHIGFLLLFIAYDLPRTKQRGMRVENVQHLSTGRNGG